MQAVIPLPFHGRWSTLPGHCEPDSDSHYVIGERAIQAWEVTWSVERVSVDLRGALHVGAVHQDAEGEFAVEIKLRGSAASRLVFEECAAGQCWQAELHRCPA